MAFYARIIKTEDGEPPVRFDERDVETEPRSNH
jgi:hypothetical protein